MYISTVFNGKNGLYYDAVGNEVFVAKFVGMRWSTVLRMEVPCYELDFGDAIVVGMVKDHGYNAFLGEV